MVIMEIHTYLKKLVCSFKNSFQKILQISANEAEVVTYITYSSLHIPYTVHAYTIDHIKVKRKRNKVYCLGLRT